jgi:hypothetical protein
MILDAIRKLVSDFLYFGPKPKLGWQRPSRSDLPPKLLDNIGIFR